MHLERYDYIIAGAGCSGLSLLVHLIRSGQFSDKKILITDRAPKTANDHTWCFWEEEAGLFEKVVSKQWSQLEVHFERFSKELQIAPYAYKMIRADDFYRYCFELIASQPNVTVKYGVIEKMESTTDGAVLTLSGKPYTAEYIFSSVDLNPLIKQPGKHYLLQHFKGWLIEAEVPVFNPNAATLMDFRIPQTAGASFVYMLPLTTTRAMIEVTIFSKQVLAEEGYEALLRNYLSKHFPGIKYRVLEEETGIIPMTNHNFPVNDGRIIYLGTAGGQTKASTGYTFKPIQAHSQRLTRNLITTGHPYLNKEKSAGRFRFYDQILLQLLAMGALPGAAVFERLFERNSPQQVFRFLDNATTLSEEFKLTMTLQKASFIKAALKEIISAIRT